MQDKLIVDLKELYPSTPLKSYYTAVEVLELLQIKSYQLRFWQSEFHSIAPMVSDYGQVLFRPEDIVLLTQIKNLLLIDKLSIERARSIIDKPLDPPSMIQPQEEENPFLTSLSAQAFMPEEAEMDYSLLEKMALETFVYQEKEGLIAPAATPLNHFTEKKLEAISELIKETRDILARDFSY
jgi:DNA-binding transcriptional MerR regulator